MRHHILTLLLFPGLLFSVMPPAAAAKKAQAGSKAADYKLIPALNWSLVSTGFVEVFKLRNREVESAEPNRFFPGSVAFALGRIDESGHYLMLKCGGADDCATKRDALEDRLVYATLLEVVRTPRVTKDQLYNVSTWELTSLGEKYMEKLRKRHPDLNTRLAKLIGAAFASQ
ncbi:MAG: hypothetical protein NDI60_10885 [Elusimicrobiales bacterium]|nr:hypothetical protein [Elusimicrobiales bacterium]